MLSNSPSLGDIRPPSGGPLNRTPSLRAPLTRFDKVEFIETPLHIAAEKGCIGFAMEIMSLKPSFARKLNHRGLSPMHIAVEKGQQEMALRLLEVEKDVVRVRGKNGETVFTTFAGRPKSPTSIASKEGLLSGSDEQTGRRRNTALHVAATKNQPQEGSKTTCISERLKNRWLRVVNVKVNRMKAGHVHLLGVPRVAMYFVSCL
ncbi:hypothetical protein F3Y22_tig00112249pilonHSYRG00108 [Hibiscus syriacus]|uniref:Uncharacterized protein n=1 Tax=Hibiscus syriacus TaxID=106335 RepID=A0A6A2X2W4_HIBSY|nr:hypothetical protein F3Y22_tig00112249pilonHSYRG00108 [Hibiscus syriacus]